MRTPRATYRLQLHAGFTFADAEAIVPYLVELGVSHIYLSPVLQAGTGSTHGYDVVDPLAVNSELGGEAGFQSLTSTARAAGLGLLLDIVPNHMSIAGAANRWWRDVLENGRSSYYAHYFDIDWGTQDDRVVLPVLGERYGKALTTGVLRVGRSDGGFRICAHDHVFPTAPRSLGPIVRRAGERAGHAELAFTGDALAGLPSPQEAIALEARRRRHRDKAVLFRRVEALAADPDVAAALEAEVAAINADPGALDAVLEAQNYRLVYWRVAAEQLSYRRFFDITTLVGLRVEEPDVLAASHSRILEWLRDGTLAGVRVDHIDGLRAPDAYLAALKREAPDAWIVVEKILADDETLSPRWSADGTTGYEVANWLTTLMIDPAAEAPLTEAFERYTGEAWNPAAGSRAARLEVMSDALHSELVRAGELALKATTTSAATRDFTRGELESTLAEIFAGYPAYRTYLPIDGDSDAATAERTGQRGRIARAVAAAREAKPELDADLSSYLERALAFEVDSPAALAFAQTAQQITGGIIAKGDEDTLAYRQVRLLARCEVGADLRVFAEAPAVVHARLAAHGPRSLIATSTHDTKRSEDVRARIAALAEIPTEWSACVQRWRPRHDAAWGEVAPDRTFELAAWQTLAGAWPVPLERMTKWAEKATREARQRTSWRRADERYERARDAWLAAIYADATTLAELEQLVELLRPRGDRIALAQLAIKLTMPGVPDLYQGTELRDDSLVDPDNRRAVDYAVRRAALADSASSDALSRAKLRVITRVLGLRREQPAIFDAPYRALAATGAEADRVFAFARGERLVVAVPRLTASAHASLALPPGQWTDVVTGRRVSGEVPVDALWQELPIAVLLSQ